MSNGSVFRIIANDGKADRMIMATALLRQRIVDIVQARKAAGKQDLTPTLVDLERTHILYVNAHYKPFAAIGYEYIKVKPQSGATNLGSSVTFSIPQYGDFFNDIVVRTQLTDCQGSQLVTPSSATPFEPGFEGFYDVFGNPLGAYGAQGLGVNYQNFVRYCEYPGYKLFQGVSFEVNGNPLDYYDSDIIVLLNKFSVPVNKSVGNDRLVGQQVPLTGYRDLTLGSLYDNDVTVSGPTVTYDTPQGISSWNTTQSDQTVHPFGVGSSTSSTNTSYALQWPQFIPQALQNSATTTSFPSNVGATAPPTSFTNVSSIATQKINLDPSVPSTSYPPYLAQGAYGTGYGPAVTASGPASSGAWQYDPVQEVVQVVNGPQTPKPAQPPLEIWNKLRFWFCDDVRLSVPSVSIPFGQRFITIDLASASDLVYEVPSVTVCYNQLYTGGEGRILQFTPYYQVGGIDGYSSSSFDILTMEMYINNIFVNPEIHDIFIKRIGFSLIRVYRKQKQQLNQDSNDVLLSQLKWPVEYMYTGFRPKFNIATPTASAGTPSGNWDIWHDWHRMTRQISASTPVKGGVCWGQTLGGTTEGVAGLTLQYSAQNGDIKYWIPVQTVDQMSLTSHGIAIFDSFRDKFYNQYTPYNYGGYVLNTPDDIGAFIINLSLFPRSYQPAGHINLSRARETYISYQSSYISATTPTDLLVAAVTINFLLISDGSAILRYST